MDASLSQHFWQMFKHDLLAHRKVCVYICARSSACMYAQVSASEAQKRRVKADKKVASYVTKRGLVPDPAAERRKGKLSAGPMLLAFFVVVIIGSTLLQIYQSASRKAP
uniref:Stress-associated endoplasmic reticulum protein n=1 Tax=Chrysotila carterae TaxID=13221 RepID=A0A7S4FBM1_CHRCT